ncbi:hypothetical protein SRIMM317S_00681 [Streptomyces rimosus subsp. rimosus]
MSTTVRNAGRSPRTAWIRAYISGGTITVRAPAERSTCVRRSSRSSGLNIALTCRAREAPKYATANEVSSTAAMPTTAPGSPSSSRSAAAHRVARSSRAA